MPSIAASTQAKSCVSVKQKAPGQNGGDGLGLSTSTSRQRWGPPRVLIQAECPVDVNRTVPVELQLILNSDVGQPGCISACILPCGFSQFCSLHHQRKPERFAFAKGFIECSHLFFVKEDNAIVLVSPSDHRVADVIR